jgi:uncharacterized RDD family membrane protein YckC
MRPRLGYRSRVSQAEQVDISEASSSHPPAPRIARLGDRAFAAILDAFIPMPLLFAINTLQAMRQGAIDDDGSYNITGAPALLGIALMFLCWMIYVIASEYWLGGILGKRLMGIQARTVDGRPITLLQSFVRNLARCVDAIGLYLVGFALAISSPQRQRLGDRIAKTAVFELDKTDRVLAFMYGVLVFLVGVLVNQALLHFAANHG